jgi:putative transposase
MSAPISLRRDFDASQLRSLAKKTAIYDGAARTEAAKIGGVGLQIIRDWVLHFNERGNDFSSWLVICAGRKSRNA